jgi:Kef-type K+ transport system membrane component KefB
MSNRTRKRLGAALMAIAVLAVPASWLLGVSLFSFKGYGSGNSPEGSWAVWGAALHWPLVLAGIAGLSGFALLLWRKHEDTTA